MQIRICTRASGNSCKLILRPSGSPVAREREAGSRDPSPMHEEAPSGPEAHRNGMAWIQGDSICGLVEAGRGAGCREKSRTAISQPLVRCHCRSWTLLRGCCCASQARRNISADENTTITWYETGRRRRFTPRQSMIPGECKRSLYECRIQGTAMVRETGICLALYCCPRVSEHATKVGVGPLRPYICPLPLD